MGIPYFTYSSPPTYTPMNIKIDYVGTVECDVDYIALDDEGAQRLYKGIYNNVINDEVTRFADKPSLKFFKIRDELDRHSAYPVRNVKEKIETKLRSISVNYTGIKSGTAIHFHDEKIPYLFSAQEFLAKTQMNFYKVDIYPINTSVANPKLSTLDDYTSSVQSAFTNIFIERLKDAAEGAIRFKVPWIYEVQAHSWRQPNGAQLREPTSFEIKAMSNLAIAYGAKGIHYFMYTKPTTITDTYVNALLDNSDVTAPQKRELDENGYPKWEPLKNYNQKLKSIGDELLKLNWTNSWYINAGNQPASTFISNVRSFTDANYSILEGANDTHIQLSAFTAGDPVITNLDYIYVVNRRTHINDKRFVELTINKTNSQFASWNVKEIGSSREWNVGKTGTFRVELGPGDAGLYKIEPVLLAGGRIVSDETAPAGQIGVKGTITVNEGHTLTVPPGASMTFNNLSSLIVNGDLLSGSNGSSPVTMDFSSGGNGITISETGIATINNTKIMNAVTGISIESQDANTITSCEIINCADGINIYPLGNATITGTKIWTTSASENGIIVQSSTNTISGCDISGCESAGILYDQLGNNYSGASIPILTNNKIHDNSYGIYFNIASVAYVTNNEIYNSGYGALANSSSPAFGYANHPGKNYIRNNYVGVYALNNANPFFGRNTYYNYGGYNAFVNNSSRNIIAEDGGYIYAHKNYWYPSTNNSAAGGSVIETNNMLPENPFDNPPQSIASISMDSELQGDQVAEGKTNSLLDQVILADDYYYHDQFRKAKKISSEIMYDYPDSAASLYALDVFMRSSMMTASKDSMKLALKDIISKHGKKKLSAKADIILALCDRPSAIHNLDQVIRKYQDEKTTETATYQKIIHSLFNLKDRALADSIYKNAGTAFHNTASGRLAGGFLYSKNNPGALNKSVDKETELEIPTEYNLLGNYPNPFNPSTTIKYSLPYNSHVEILIYDVMGRKIRNLIPGTQSKGYQQAVWNGLDNFGNQVSSGIYIYRFSAKSIETVDKEFVKTAKMMLLK